MPVSLLVLETPHTQSILFILSCSTVQVCGSAIPNTNAVKPSFSELTVSAYNLSQGTLKKLCFYFFNDFDNVFHSLVTFMVVTLAVTQKFVE